MAENIAITQVVSKPAPETLALQSTAKEPTPLTVLTEYLDAHKKATETDGNAIWALITATNHMLATGTDEAYGEMLRYHRDNIDGSAKETAAFLGAISLPYDVQATAHAVYAAFRGTVCDHPSPVNARSLKDVRNAHTLLNFLSRQQRGAIENNPK